MRKEDNLENEIKDLRHQGSAESRQRIFGEVRQALGEKPQQQAVHAQRHIWRIVMQTKMIKYVAAAVIILGVMAGIYVLNGTVEISSAVLATELAQLQENMQNAPWLYMERETSVGIYETWIGFETRLLAGQFPSGGLFLYNHQERRRYEYDPDTDTIKVAPSYSEELPASPLDFVNYIIKGSQDEGYRITRKNRRDNGKKIDIYIIEIPGEDENIILTLQVDTQSRLPVGLEILITDPRGKIKESSSYTSTIEYPKTGPKTIYDMGAPDSAKIDKIVIKNRITGRGGSKIVDKTIDDIKNPDKQ